MELFGNDNTDELYEDDDVKNNLVTHIKGKIEIEIEQLGGKKKFIESTKILIKDWEELFGVSIEILRDNKLASTLYNTLIVYMQNNVKLLEQDIISIQININFNKIMIKSLESKL